MNNIVLLQRKELEELVKSSVEQSIKSYYDAKEKKKQQKQLLSVKETAKILGVTELTVRNYIKRGLIKARRIDNRIFISRKRLEESLKEVKSLKYKRDVKVR